MSETANAGDAASQVDQAVARDGAYEVLRKRLAEQGARLRATAERLNTERLGAFGDSALEVIGRLRIRTEHNCVGRDIVHVGDAVLFGYNVYFGLKAQAGVADVFGLYRLVEGAEGYDVEPLDMAASFLGDAGFARDFAELYAYYKHARLVQLDVHNGKLLAAFQIGERSTDLRVFRWSIDHAGTVTYIDARGERDLPEPAPFDFAWTRATREMAVSGRHPHLNILDTLFVETTGGDLTIKVENNTESGQGLHSEPVEDRTQSLDDATFDFARVGSLILLKVLPYRETAWRGFVYNTLTGKVARNDAIVQACVQLPEDHGIIFPGGYVLQNGEHKAFDASMAGMQFKRAVRSPNGEDVLYEFYEPVAGKSALFVYNTIRRKLQTPLFAHGHARFADGRMVLFLAESDEPTRIHPMQVWRTPFASEEFAAARPPGTGFMARIGNAELVRAVSSFFDLAAEIDREDVSAQRYQLLVQQVRRLFDAHHWIDDANCGGAAGLLHDIAATGESVLDEFEKVESIRAQSAKALADAQAAHRALSSRLQPQNWTAIEEFVDALTAITQQRGHLQTIREQRYIDVDAIDAMATDLEGAQVRVGVATGSFLAGKTALAPFGQRLDALDVQAGQAETAKGLAEALDAMAAMSRDLDLLSELVATLSVDDATERTRVVDAISNLYARLNQVRARAEQKKRTLGSAEVVAQFGAQFALFGQATASALGLATDPERVDEQLSRLMVHLEEIESQFGEHEQFLGDILAKREELLETFEARKQQLLDERQRKAQSVMDAAARILGGLARRTERFATMDALNAFFAGDALILKLRELAARLRELQDSVKADDVEARLKGVRDQALRALRDRSELFEDGGNIIKLGSRHRFSVNTQPLDLTLLPREDGLALHLTGTDFLEPVASEELAALRPFWQATLDSESAEVYRGEFLAGQVVEAAETGTDGLTLDLLDRQATTDPAALAKTLRDFAAPRYREGYEKGIHDHDAAALLRAWWPLRKAAGPLVHAPASRALAVLFWSAHVEGPDVAHWVQRTAGVVAIQRLFGAREGLEALRREMSDAIGAFVRDSGLSIEGALPGEAADVLVTELAGGEPTFRFSRDARRLLDALRERLRKSKMETSFDTSMDRLEGRLPAQVALATQWLSALASDAALAPLARHASEAAALLLTEGKLRQQVLDVPLSATVDGLLGTHPRIVDGKLGFSVDDLAARLRRHREAFVPGFQRYQAMRQDVIARERDRLRVSEYQARPLTSFVRNKLINDIYLPLIGDNLAKQMGTVGDAKRSDLMGLLMLISPPGYGKTTLMEYVAHRLGLVFMKINGPALGHDVRSLDPARAPDATSRQELEKLNLALEMGNNTMLYVDDIQHTHPEFLQKFISLCDGTRRIEGVWKGRTRTYDLRGKRFCVVMAGNPYTESGEVFKIPDMLANRADIYNLGDVLGGMEEAFVLSYLENCLTSNAVLAPMATRDLADLYLLVDKAAGRAVSTNRLVHGYSDAEINEITGTLQRLMKVRDVVYRVNQQYIASAAQADKYRTEPPFKLQGSYRNMNKLAEKISPVMNDTELQQLIADHYLGEAQLLTTGAEENLLKLAELRGVMTKEQAARWAQIKRDFLRNKAMGAEEGDVGGRVVAQLADIASGLQAMRGDEPVAVNVAPDPAPWGDVLALLERLAARNDTAATASPLAGLPDVMQAAIGPLLEALQASRAQQGEINVAMLQLAEAIRAGGLAAAPAAPTTSTPRRERKLTHEEIAFNKELRKLKFKEDEDGSKKK